MLLRSTRLLNTHRLVKLADKYQTVFAKKQVEFDYVAVDASGLIGPALRLTKNAPTEARKNKEVARHVAYGMTNILKRFHARKGFAVFLDGAEPLWKARKTRFQSVTKKVEGRLMRLPGTSLSLEVEERLYRLIPEHHLFPAQIVFSGPLTEGPIEQKFAQWALDLAALPSTKPTDSVAVFGGNELHASSLALVPFTNCSNLVNSNNDFRQLHISELLQWLGLGEVMETATAKAVAQMRIDLTLLWILCFGLSATELSAVPGLGFSDCVEAYHRKVKKEDDGFAMMNPSPSGRFCLNPAHLLECLLSAKKSGTLTPLQPPRDTIARDYIELVLQSHQMLTLGQINMEFVPYSDEKDLLTFPITPTFEELCCALQSLGKNDLFPAKTDTLPLTAAEFTCFSQPNLYLASTLSVFAGQGVREEVLKDSFKTGNSASEAALSEIRHILKHANPQRPHRALSLCPSVCWMQNTFSKCWNYWYVDLGKMSANKNIATKTLEDDRAFSGSGSMNVSVDKPVHFIDASKSWEVYHPTPDVSLQKKTAFRIATWNVMFDRYSNQPTPLGKPGIDWCSHKRYPVICKVLASTDADVIGMQEVEPQFWDFLEQEPWVRENYVFSCDRKGSAINPWGVLLLVHKRLSISRLGHHNIPAFPGHISLMPYVVVNLKGTPLTVAALHLLAPYTKNHETVRTSQDNVLRTKLLKGISGDCLAMGDFNDWPESQFEMPEDGGYVDAWMEVCPEHPGKTMDETNEFCKLKIEEEFFGRSDKIFLRSKKIKPTGAFLIGTKSVNEEDPTADAPQYLFPSDHYGVVVDFLSSG